MYQLQRARITQTQLLVSAAFVTLHTSISDAPQ
jgi:hypothetical protein